MNFKAFPNRSGSGGSWSNQPGPSPNGPGTVLDENNNGDCFLPKPPAALANNVVCSARRKKAGGLVHCLVANAYARPFGERVDYDWLCCHPDREDIIFRTEAKSHQ